MTEKELMCNNLWNRKSKVILCNVSTGEIKYIKTIEQEESSGCTETKNFEEHARRVVAGGFIMEADVEGYLKHTSLCYMREKLAVYKGSLLFSYRRKVDDEFIWHSFEIVKTDEYSAENPWVFCLTQRANSESYLMQDAIRMLSLTYHKILRVNLSNDSYEVIKTYEHENGLEYGISDSISAWFRNFALRGYVHEEDLEAYLMFTEIGSLRKRFRESRIPQEIRYRRRSGTEYRWVQMYLMPSSAYQEEHEEVMLFIRDLEEYI